MIFLHKHSHTRAGAGDRSPTRSISSAIPEDLRWIENRIRQTLRDGAVPAGAAAASLHDEE